MLVAVALGCLCQAQAAALLGTSPYDGRFAESVASAGDLNGDGKCDWLVADSAPGFAWAISGSNVKPLFYLGSRAPGRGGFTNVTSLGDVDGDKTPDVLVSAGPLSRQLVRAYSGKDQHVLFSVPGEWAAPVGDVDRDGKPDFVTTSVTASTLGARSTAVLMEVRSGAGGMVLREIRRADETGYDRMVRTAALGDVDRDGVADWAAILLERIVVFSGRTGDELRAFGKRNDLPPSSICALSDVNGDGVGELLVTRPRREDSGFSGSLIMYSGADGTMLQVHENPFELSRARASSLADINGDGRLEFAIVDYSETWGADGVGIYSGATAGYVRSLAVNCEVESGGETAVTAVPDVDGDGVPDLLVGSPSSVPGSRTTGAARIYSGETAGLLRVISLEKLRNQLATNPR